MSFSVCDISKDIKSAVHLCILALLHPCLRQLQRQKIITTSFITLDLFAEYPSSIEVLLPGSTEFEKGMKGYDIKEKLFR